MPNPKHVKSVSLFSDAVMNSVYVKTNDSIRMVNEAPTAQFKFLTTHFPTSEQNIEISH
jgi:hypothetical protein